MLSNVTIFSYKPLNLNSLPLAEGFPALKCDLGSGVRTSRGLHDIRERPQQRFWMSRDEAILERYYPSSTPVREISEALDRSVSSVRAKARQLGLKRPSRSLTTARAVNVQESLPALLPEVELQEQSDRFRMPKTRSGRAIWTVEAKDYLAELWKRLFSAVAIAEHLGLRTCRVSMAANRMGLPQRYGVSLLHSVPEVEPLAVPINATVAGAMFPKFCLKAKTRFFVHPSRRRSTHLSQQGHAMMDRAANGYLH